MTDLGTHQYLLRADVNDLGELEELFRKEMEQDPAATFLPEWLKFQEWFADFFEFFESEFKAYGGTARDGYSVDAGYKDYDLSHDITYTHVGKDITMTPLEKPWTFSPTADRSDNHGDHIRGMVDAPKEGLYMKVIPLKTLKDEFALRPGDPSGFRQDLERTLEGLEDEEKRHNANEAFYEFYKDRTPFTKRDLQERMRANNGYTDTLHGGPVDEALNQGVKRGMLEKEGETYHPL